MAEITGKKSTRSKKQTSKKEITRKEILEAYMDYVSEHGSAPLGLRKFMREMGSDESQFYQFFPSFDALPSHFWEWIVESSIETCQKDENWTSFTSRERLLGFYYTLIANLNQNRSFFLWTLERNNFIEVERKLLARCKIVFRRFIAGLVSVGGETGEIIERPYISKGYPDILWFHFLFVVKFWKEDMSSGFENTDAAIEKSVTLAYELLGRSPLDAMIDFGKFLVQHSKSSI